MKCPKCGWNDHISSEERSRRVKRGHDLARKAGKKIGRPIESDYDEIRRLRKKGLSLMKIAEAVSSSRGAVQYALRKKPQPKGKEP